MNPDGKPDNRTEPLASRRTVLKMVTAIGAASTCAVAARSVGATATVPAIDESRRLPTSRTGFVTDSAFERAVFAPTHPEQPERVTAIWQALDRHGLRSQLKSFAPRPDIDDALGAIHTQAHRDGIRHTHGEAVDATARTAVGAAIAAVDAVAKGEARNAFVASRPPGHHARNDGHEEGFCFYNNVAVAARHLQRAHGVPRVMIIDWDYHHGDGTEHLFYEDPSVFYFSTCDPTAYPNTADPRRTGAGPGKAYSLTVPMACGTTDAQILQVYSEQLVPAADRFKPDFVLISAGFDSRIDDRLGCFAITDQGFAEMTRVVAGLAARHCDGRMVSVLEGGYNIPGLASAATAHVQALMAAAG